MTPKPTILLVDDDLRVLDSLKLLFEDDYEPLCAASGSDAISMVVDNNSISVAVVDMKMKPIDGLETALQIKKHNSEIEIIIHTGYPGEYQESELERAFPMYAFVLKGQSVPTLLRTVKHAVEAVGMRQTIAGLGASEKGAFGMIGRSSGMMNVYQLIRKSARTDVNVIVLGESGTGKELVSRAIHDYSPRKGKFFGVFDCTNINPQLAESELFGHVRGSFTYAYNDHIGLAELCHGGTLFLDEIGELHPELQQKLLRALDPGEFHRIGESRSRKSEFRLVCATNKNLKESVKQGRFRDDLYNRIHGLEIHTTPLRDRRDDIPLLAQYFLDRLTTEYHCSPRIFDRSAIDALQRHEWREGNVRELIKIVKILLTTGDDQVITSNAILMSLETKSHENHGDGLYARIEAYKYGLVAEALNNSNGNVAEAARLLKMDPANLRKYIRGSGISLE